MTPAMNGPRIVVVGGVPSGGIADQTNGFTARYRRALEFFDEAASDLFVIFLSQDHAVEIPVDGAPTGARAEVVYTDPLVRNRSARVADLALHAGGKVVLADWERGLRARVVDWSPDLIVVLCHADRRNARAVMDLAPVVLFAEEDASANPEFRRSWAGRALRGAEIWAERRAPHAPAVVVVISERERAWAARTFPRSRVRVVQHNLDDDYWSASPRSEMGGACDVFVMCRLDHERNVRGLVEVSQALARLAAKGVDVPRLVVASSDEPHPSFRDAAHELIDFAGPVVDPRPYYRSALATLVPSFIVMGAKTTILQGWATQCPVVTTTAAAASVGATNGRELVCGSTPDEVAALVVRVAKDLSLGLSLGEAGRARYEQMHSPIAVRRELEETMSVAMAIGRRFRRASSS
jgi:glycosyltransferase involved in cell wall biosynthesis